MSISNASLATHLLSLRIAYSSSSGSSSFVESSHSSSLPASPQSVASEIDPETNPGRKFVLVTSGKINPEGLKSIVQLEGADLFIGLVVESASHCSQRENLKDFVLSATATLARNGLWAENARWKKKDFQVKGENLTYLVSGENAHGDGGFLNEIVLDDVSRFSLASALRIFSFASLRSVVSLQSSTEKYTFHVLEEPAVAFSPLGSSLLLPGYQNDVSKMTPFGVPSTQDWQDLWKAWDLVTLAMIPQEMLHQKPIDLRHKCLFYIGHIPTFVDMLLSKSIGGKATEPSYFWNIFERGIDPHVDDPDHCHNHSEVPDRDEDWPTLATILGFRDRVRARLLGLYEELENGKRAITRNIARTLVMTLEHEGFHVETLLYMLLQRAGSGTLPPPGFTTPPWALLSSQWECIPPPTTKTTLLGPAIVTLGHQDSEADDCKPDLELKVEGHAFGWDNESPPRCFEVKAFRVEWRPVTNGEFERFWREGGNVQMPKSWVEEDGEIKVRTMYGPISMLIARHWPVLTSYDDLSTFARARGGRLPTEPELRLFLDSYEVGHVGGSNVGFRNWHPVAATTGLSEYGGKGSNGGVWEWTTTSFDGHAGLAPTNIFTGYSTDFFDGKHQVVLGASYATIPRLAGRRTVRNFYQHNYPYPWVGARVVYDI